MNLKHHQPIFTQTNKTPKPEKAQNIWAFCTEKAPTKRIIS